MPQPNFVPVIPRRSRRTHSSGVSSAADTSIVAPLIVSFIVISLWSVLFWQALEIPAWREPRQGGSDPATRPLWRRLLISLVPHASSGGETASVRLERQTQSV